MASTDEELLPPGFYSWDGNPCRVLPRDGETGILRAERYIGGRGYVEIDRSFLFFEGARISETHFKTLVLEEIGAAAADERSS